MRIVFRNISVVVTLVLSTSLASAQKWVRVPDAPADKVVHLANEVYGHDQQLINGVFFDNVYRGAEGHPYLKEDAFVEGSLVFRNKPYESVMIKYDIYAQQLLINHLHDGYTMASILTNEFINAFSLHGKDFRKMTLEDASAPVFYQVLSEFDHLKCYVYWFKVRNESIGDNNSRLDVFMPDKRRFYLQLGGETAWFQNNWTLKRQFSGEIQRELRRYLRINNLKVQESSDQEMRELLEHFNRWIEERE